jgi:hypothetical protein
MYLISDYNQDLPQRASLVAEWLRFVYSQSLGFLFLVFKMFRTRLEKIVVQGQTDFEKQVHGDPLLSAHFIDVLGSAVHLLGQPCG